MGLQVARQVHRELNRQDVDLVEAAVGGLEVLDIISGYDWVIIIDALVSPDDHARQVYRVALSDAPTYHLSSSHSVGLEQALKLGEELGMAMPRQVIIYGVAVQDVYDFGETLSPGIAQAVPNIAQQIAREIRAGLPS